MPDLTPAEIKFFETGELPAELEAEAAAAAAAANPEPAPTPAPAPAPAPAPIESPAPAPAPALDDTPAPEPDSLVELRAQLEASRRTQAQIEANLRALTENLKPQPQPEPEPDPVKDPLGALMYKLNAVNQQVQELQQNLSQQQQRQVADQEFTQFVSAVKAQKIEFAKTQTDFDSAYQHLRGVRAADLRDMGLDNRQVEEALLRDEIALSLRAQQEGKNAAQVIYNMAKRYGYQARAAAPAPAPAPAQKIEQLAKGVSAADDVPRAGLGGELTLDSLKDAGDADLNKLVQNDQLWNRIVGNDADTLFN